IGRASGEDRCSEAAKQAIHSPLLETSIDGAKKVLINITGGPDLGLLEVDAAANMIYEAADPNANIIWGAAIDENMGDEVMVTVIATGFDGSMPIRTSKYIEKLYKKDKVDEAVGNAPETGEYEETGPEEYVDSEESYENESPYEEVVEIPEEEEDDDKGINIPNFLRKL
ncbi:MAG: cell division protein FtsZ, partial [Clostridia bacterium]|nr:cell division protein FtsZ [Clostridia bacterium]